MTHPEHDHRSGRGTDPLEDHDHERGLAFDLQTLTQQALGRRRALALLGGAGLATLVGCAVSPSTVPQSASTPSTATGGGTTGGTSDASAECSTEIPDETGGPYPGDGSNGPDVLSVDGVVRGDIRSSFGGPSGTAEGVPLSFALTVVDLANGCAAMPSAAVYAWHCDREGRYSMYSQGIQDENYLRGVLAADATGTVEFTSVFPGCYSGRWPHLHFEVYESVAAATSGQQPLKTSQLAFPQSVCETVYATSGYDASVVNLARLSLSSDNVFGDDGGTHQLATVTGSTTDGYRATLTVPI